MAGALGLSAVSASEPLDVVLVQYQVNAQDYSSLERFRARIDAIVGNAVAQSDPDLIVFPEYASVFALFTDLITERGEVTLEGVSPDVVALMDSGENEMVGVRDEAHRFIRRRARRFGARIMHVWSTVAADHKVWIVAGSGFVPAPDRGVYNRVWVFDRSGEIRYQQDKVFLTAFEREKLGLVPGSIREADTFAVEGIDLAVTICRDSYFDAWEREFADADAWIDVRANGEEYTAAVRRRFDTALPERVAESPVPLGLSTSLNGRFLELLWQGPAFVVDDDGDRIGQSPTVDGDYLMEVEVPDVSTRRINSVD